MLYDCRLITHCLTSMMVHHADHDIPHLIYAIRLCLLRNLGNITAPKLYNHAFSGTKVLIEEFNKQLELSIHYIRTLPVALSDESGSASNGDNPGVRTQTKMNVIHDMRQAYGRSTLVLQGGAIFGLYHLGVIRALFLRGLLPRIITGTATGALIAALVCVHTEEELPAVLRGDGIDLSAFSKGDETGHGQPWRSLLMTLGRRLWRYVREGYFLDIGVLEECVRANVGELTFEEAYNRTKRVLNITVATCDDAGIPTLLNHVTAPHVVRPHDCFAPYEGPVHDADMCSSSGQRPWPPMHILPHSTGTARPWCSARTRMATSSRGPPEPRPSSDTGRMSATPAASPPCTARPSCST